MVGQVMLLCHLNSGHPYCPVFRWLLYLFWLRWLRRRRFCFCVLHKWKRRHIDWRSRWYVRSRRFRMINQRLVPLLLNHCLLLLLLRFQLRNAAYCDFVGRIRRIVRIFFFQSLVDHFDDGGYLIFAVSVEKFAVAPLAVLHLVQVLQGVLVAVVAVLLHIAQLEVNQV